MEMGAGRTESSRRIERGLVGDKQRLPFVNKNGTAQSTGKDGNLRTYYSFPVPTGMTGKSLYH